MSKLKKIILSLSIAITMLIAFVIGINLQQKSPLGALNSNDTQVSSTVNENNNAYSFAPGEVVIQKGGQTLDYSFSPTSNSKDSATTVAYEYMFGNSMDQQAAVNLKSINGTSVTIRYAYSSTQLTSLSTITGVEKYTTQILPTKGSRVYIYILVTPTDETIPTTFNSSVIFYYGKPVNVTHIVNNEEVTETIVKGQEYHEPEYLPKLDNGYSAVLWFYDAEYTKPVNFPIKKQGFTLYAQYPNLPEDWLAFDETKQCYYIKRGTSALQSNLILPSTYNGYDVTYIDSATDPANGVFYMQNFTSVVIPKNITTIGECGFFDCRNLTSIKLLGYLESVGNRAFSNCYALFEMYNLSTSIELVPGSTNNGYIANYIKSMHNDLSIPTTIVQIDNISYYKETENRYIALAPTIDRLEINSIVLDKRTVSFAPAAFNECYGLIEIDFSKCASNIESFSSSMLGSSVLLTTVDLSQCVKITELSGNMLRASGINTILLPPNLKTIPASAFEKCTKLSSIIIPEGVTNIGDLAFNGCTNLTTIYNLSSLDIVAGADTYGGIAKYATNIYTTLH